MWSWDQQHQHHWRACDKCRLQGLATPGLLGQKLWMWITLDPEKPSCADLGNIGLTCAHMTWDPITWVLPQYRKINEMLQISLES